MTSAKALERSDRGRVLAGVFGGLGEYFDVNASLLRIVGVVLLIVIPAPMVLLYTVAALVMPRKGGKPSISQASSMSTLGPIILGLVLVLAGLVLAGGGFLPFFFLNLTGFAGLVITAVGAWILAQGLRRF
jgi:phage shock protein PspC (stress-responsive transcriptional regulator)